MSTLAPSPQQASVQVEAETVGVHSHRRDASGDPVIVNGLAPGLPKPTDRAGIIGIGGLGR